MDIDPRTFNIDPSKLEPAVQAVLDNQATDHDHPLPRSGAALVPRGIIAVDLFGLPADYQKINAIAAANQLFVIEDAAQSFGARYQDRQAALFPCRGGSDFCHGHGHQSVGG